ncbi:Stk1 family PASTA domain-containing Ser/Thr kinase [Arsenicicoccus bolidensis]|uniref:Stk1 family PASTA domain-containing Ser/Thr kinase n=1 Tax=Arsenicicoccus bolidensis TaxID=229480 RepID=UPI0028AD5B99|nr:Stk1 family PASTA domain-containing Ser/Thr kinase [Arsenicicoccus bolidensis]
MPRPTDVTAPGRVLDGRYRLVRHIADGGMASVWEGLDERLDREVAVKILRRGLTDDESFTSRFQREARSAARLNDPRIVAVFDQGIDHDDMFLVMELVPGRTLREVVHAEAPLTVRAALDLVVPLAEALGVAHRAGIIHRDVKPENVIIRDDGRVKVADFGLARAVTAQTVTAASSTILGTVSYLSPEQVERGIADARSDVYATGLILYELLTGQKAYEGESPIHVAYQHVHGSITAPSEVVPSVPAALDEVVAWATHRDAGERPADGAALAERLREVRAELSPDDLDARPREPEASAARATPTVAIPRSGATGSARPIPTPVQHRDPVGATRGAASPSAAPRRRRLRLLLPLLAFLVLLGGGGAWYLTQGPGASTTVPALQGLALADAQSRLAAAHLDAAIEETYDERVPRGSVIQASPREGTALHRTDDVTLVVSRGPERYQVPQVRGTPVDAARQALKDTRLSVGAVTEAHDEQVPAGQVVSTDPAAGASLKPLTKVALVVSKGRQPIPVPALAGRTSAEARTALTAAGLTYAEAPDRVYSTTVPEGSVTQHSPASGTLFKGDTVTVTLSKGPELVAVPSVRGRSKDDAVAALKAAGFQVRVSAPLGEVFGLVSQQRPSGGRAPKGSTVTVVVV